MSGSYIEISKDALSNNIRFVRSLIGGHVKLSSVVKGNAYGHGVNLMVPALESLGIDHFSVFSSNEARDVFTHATSKPSIMVMGNINQEDEEWIINHEIEFYVFNKDRLLHMTQLAKKLGKKAHIHLEIESGMNRTGINKPEWKEVIQFFKVNQDTIRFAGICTHYAGAESIANYKRIIDQKKTFSAACKQIYEAGLTPDKIHTSCSAAIIMYPKNNFDMVRIGILQYGLWPSKESFIHYSARIKNMTDPLRMLFNWKSYIMDIKSVKKGNYIGYGTSYMAEQDMRIASVPVGYGYGYSRSLSNQGRVIVRGMRLSVIGIVNMNMLMIDISSLEEVKLYDEVILIGKQGDTVISVSSFSDQSSQLNYEMLTRIDKSIPRKMI